MSFLRLGSGSILVVDALGKYSPDASTAAEVQHEIDVLTNCGRWMEAVVFTHPFHTGGVEVFHRTYPDVPMYGAPRHLDRFPHIPWAGVLTDEAVRARWEPAVSMRIPAGTEYVKPVPEAFNHLSTCLVFHRESRTLHADDFFQYFDRIWDKMGKLAWGVLKALGIKDGMLLFHNSLKSGGLAGSAENPILLIASVEEMLCQWDMENICTAHNGVLRGNARHRVRELLEATKPALRKLSEKMAKGEGLEPAETSHMWGRHEKETECG
mmetsp:Transcript_14514/g.46507  ORF Transcript_14514/g.46507 Transcript_14514/m.46507 type:complete len:267 (-) Transcript_14514:81-881(-)